MNFSHYNSEETGEGKFAFQPRWHNSSGERTLRPRVQQKPVLQSVSVF